MMKNVLALLVFSICCYSCANPSSKDQSATTAVSTDSLVNIWNKAWNNQDSAAITNLMSKDIVFIGDGKIQKGIDTVAKKFVGPNSKVIKNLKTEMLSAGVSGDQAYYYGTYTHDVALKDTTLTNRNGIFSVIYTKEQNQWKIKLVDIAENFK